MVMRKGNDSSLLRRYPKGFKTCSFIALVAAVSFWGGYRLETVYLLPVYAGNNDAAQHNNNQGDETPAASYERHSPLNVVLLFADDWSYETLGAAALGRSNSVVQTPHLDRLASAGLSFSHNCVVTSICMQSRATLYTGQYSSVHKTFYSWKNVTMYEPKRWSKTLYPLMLNAGYHVGVRTERCWQLLVGTFSNDHFLLHSSLENTTTWNLHHFRPFRNTNRTHTNTT